MGFGIAFLGAALGSMLQNKRDKKAYNAAQAQNEQRRGDYYVNLRDDAEKGGFNPLTALRSGGGMGYSSLAGRITQPLMTRSPLAAGISAGTGAYLGELTRQKQYSHESRMDELNKSLMRAQIQSMTSDLTRAQEEVFLFNQDGTHMTDEMGNKIKVDPTGMEAIPKFRLVYDQATKQTYAILNPEITEAGPAELATGVAMDAAAQSAHTSGLGVEFSIGGYTVGIPANPLGLSRNNQGNSLGWGMQP